MTELTKKRSDWCVMKHKEISNISSDIFCAIIDGNKEKARTKQNELDMILLDILVKASTEAVMR